MKKLTLGLLVLLSGCAAGRTEIHGSLIKPADVDKLRVGVHTKHDVVRLLGTPSTVSTLNEEKWFYITDTTVTEPLRKPYLKERQVFAVSFNKNGRLEQIFEKDESSTKQFKPSDKTTYTQGQNYGVFEQIFENLTSFNN